ncbi:uncharacterized protein EI90DRAFT_3076528, partial [Cantharellus anzutake]|uniref:uncharacterized protein n=1 Tax=Cantharellus anzutake TaxID=1750568 RepID=UPI001907F879
MTQQEIAEALGLIVRTYCSGVACCSTCTPSRSRGRHRALSIHAVNVSTKITS